jgi:glutamyl-tRNA synthetase
MKERTNTINELADAAMLFYRTPKPDAALLAQHLTDAVRPALAQFAEQAADGGVEQAGAVRRDEGSAGGERPEDAAAGHAAAPAVTGQLQTPAIDAVLELFGRETVLARVQKGL